MALPPQAHGQDILKTLIFILCWIAIQHSAFAGDRDRFSTALRWEEKWNRITTTNTEKYLSRIETGPFSSLSSGDRNSAIDELRQSLNGKLAWDTVGHDLSQGIIKYCDRNVLNTMTRFYNRELVLEYERKAAAKEYASCARKGFSESLSMLRSVIISSRSEVESILRKYR